MVTTLLAERLGPCRGCWRMSCSSRRRGCARGPAEGGVGSRHDVPVEARPDAALEAAEPDRDISDARGCVEEHVGRALRPLRVNGGAAARGGDDVAARGPKRAGVLVARLQDLEEASSHGFCLPDLREQPQPGDRHGVVA